MLPIYSHTLRGCVDWNIDGTKVIAAEDKSHPSWVCGLKLFDKVKYNINTRHTLRGCVDWNPKIPISLIIPYVTPFVGVWIETLLHGWWYTIRWSHPSWVCGLKLSHRYSFRKQLPSHPSWVCGLKLIRRLYIIFCVRHTLRGCVDWNLKIGKEAVHILRSHPSWVCGLKHDIT